VPSCATPTYLGDDQTRPGIDTIRTLDRAGEFLQRTHCADIRQSRCACNLCDVDDPRSERGDGAPLAGRDVTFVVEYEDAKIGRRGLRDGAENAQVEQHAPVTVERQDAPMGDCQRKSGCIGRYHSHADEIEIRLMWAHRSPFGGSICKIRYDQAVANERNDSFQRIEAPHDISRGRRARSGLKPGTKITRIKKRVTGERS
jgi:hypothetical protein